VRLHTQVRSAKPALDGDLPETGTTDHDPVFPIAYQVPGLGGKLLCIARDSQEQMRIQQPVHSATQHASDLFFAHSIEVIRNLDLILHETDPSGRARVLRCVHPRNPGHGLTGARNDYWLALTDLIQQPGKMRLGFVDVDDFRG